MCKYIRWRSFFKIVDSLRRIHSRMIYKNIWKPLKCEIFSEFFWKIGSFTHRRIRHTSSRRWWHRIRCSAIRWRRIPPRGKASRRGDRCPMESLAPHHFIRWVHHSVRCQAYSGLDPGTGFEKSTLSNGTINWVPATAALFGSKMRSHLCNRNI